MTKVFKDEKIFNKFKKQFKFIFKNKNFINLTQNHFNKNGSLAVFTLAFLQNQVDEKKILKSVKINSDEWLELFSDLYNDESIKLALEKISLNPLVTIDKIKLNFDAFNKFIERLFNYIEQQGWVLNITDTGARELLRSVFGYITYNSIECKLDRELSDIVKDSNYDQKYLMILTNTKLFSEAKNNIREYCGQKINDLIVILLGGSNHLALDK